MTQAERYKYRSIAVGLILGLEGAKMLLYGFSREDAGLATAGGIVMTASSSLILYGLTVLGENFKIAKKEFNNIKTYLASINK
jgi:hypothetical protein